MAEAAAAGTARAAGGAADSYIGSLISLTSKCEIRYEGVLYNINTEESSIGLRNVRSFGTEGRKKDGPQIPPSDKIYEYILFRGSDIKDLQVKSSPPPAQPAPLPLHNDPAIIQSHYPRPTTGSTSMPSVGSGAGTDLLGHGGVPRASFQGNIPLYQPGGSLSTWSSSPALPTANGSGIGMPMYWQGFYAPSTGLPQFQPPPLLRPPPGLQIPHSMQQPLQYPGINMQLPSLPPNLSSGASNILGVTLPMQAVSAIVPEVPSLSPPITSSSGLAAAILPATSGRTVAAPLATEISQTRLSNRTTVSGPHTISIMSLETPAVSNPESIIDPSSSKARVTSGTQLTFQTDTKSLPTTTVCSSVSQPESVAHTLVTPDRLMQSGTSIIMSSLPSRSAPKAPDVTLTPESSKEVPVEVKEKTVFAESKEPILPTPPDRKIGGTSLQSHAHHSTRGRGRGRGARYSRPNTKFAEEFDFTAMNEKFNKDEVWGHLGKSKVNTPEKAGDFDDGEYYDIEEDYTEMSKTEVKSVYVKENFFDSLSCNDLDRGGMNGRMRFSEQLKIDAETFGDLSKHRSASRGGRGRGFRGGRTGGSFYGRGYGYQGRGRGRGGSRGYPAQNWAS